jgi:molybdopterin-guanine dinucleotide biosynthesis adapter protein
MLAPLAAPQGGVLPPWGGPAATAAMKVIGFCGWSGSGKTTLIEGVIAALKAAGQRVSVVKHAHHRFDIDHEGKDSWRHRKAGAFEVLVASSKRLALMREYEDEVEHDVHQLIAELAPVADWVLIEGFKHADLLKIEVWRQAAVAQWLMQSGSRHDYPR